METSGGDLGSDFAWVKLLAVLDTGTGSKQRHLPSADFLIRNTWGKMLYVPLDPGHVENNLLRCYEIGKGVWRYQGQAPPGRFEYQVHHARTLEDAQAEKNIKEFTGSFRNNNSGKPVL